MPLVGRQRGADVLTDEAIERIEARRLALGIGVNELDRKCGWSNGEASRLLGGKRRDPALSSMVDLVGVLGTTVDWIVFGRGQSELSGLDRYPGLTAALTFARASEDFSDREALDQAAGIALGMMHDGAEQKGSDEHLRVLRRLYQDALVKRSVEGRAEDAVKAAADLETARAKAKHTKPALPPRRVK